MKIAVVSDYFYPCLGGITEHVYNFSKYAIKSGHDVRLITPSPHNYTKEKIRDLDDSLLPGSIIRLGHHLPIFSNGSLSRIGLTFNIEKKLKKIFNEENFDVIHVHSPLAGFIPMLSVKYSNTLTVGTIHTYFNSNFWFEKFKKYLVRYYDRLDGCISVSESSRELIHDYLGRTPTVIPNGIDVNLFGSTNEKVEKFNDGKINIFFIGRAEIRNGIDVLIKAFLKALDSFDNMRLIITGDGPYLAYFQDLVPAKNKNDVVFTGRVLEERPQYYNTCDVHVFPAEIATFSITVLEGLAAGRPVISTDMKSFKEIMSDGKEGYLVKYGDVDTMADRILQLARDKNLRERMGKAARERALQFSWEAITEKIINFYKECHKKAIQENRYPVI